MAFDATNVRSSIGYRVSMVVQNLVLMLVACTIGFVLQWRLDLVLIAVFPIMVAANLYPKVQAVVDRVLSRIFVMGRE